jgi:hypothetical protein
MEHTRTKLRVVNFVSSKSLANVRQFLNRNGFHIFELNGQNVADAQSFFSTVISSFPQDPPLSGRVNWDAFLDSLWGGLDSLGEKRVAFIWINVEKMLDHGLADLFIAAECFQQLASDVATDKYGISQPVELFVFLVGEGGNFKIFDGGAI